jgi:hypothetical protein
MAQMCQSFSMSQQRGQTPEFTSMGSGNGFKASVSVNFVVSPLSGVIYLYNSTNGNARYKGTGTRFQQKGCA